MTFRHDSKRGMEFRRWQRRANGWLLASGVPGDLYASLHAWGYFIEHGEFPGVYCTTRDAALLGSEDRQLALIAAILTTPGASEGDARNVLPPYAFPHLWRTDDGRHVLTDAAKRLATSEPT